MTTDGSFCGGKITGEAKITATNKPSPFNWGGKTTDKLQESLETCLKIMDERWEGYINAKTLIRNVATEAQALRLENERLAARNKELRDQVDNLETVAFQAQNAAIDLAKQNTQLRAICDEMQKTLVYMQDNNGNEREVLGQTLARYEKMKVVKDD